MWSKSLICLHIEHFITEIETSLSNRKWLMRASSCLCIPAQPVQAGPWLLATSLHKLLGLTVVLILLLWMAVLTERAGLRFLCWHVCRALPQQQSQWGCHLKNDGKNQCYFSLCGRFKHGVIWSVGGYRGTLKLSWGIWEAVFKILLRLDPLSLLHGVLPHNSTRFSSFFCSFMVYKAYFIPLPNKSASVLQIVCLDN